MFNKRKVCIASIISILFTLVEIVCYSINIEYNFVNISKLSILRAMRIRYTLLCTYNAALYIV